MFWGSVCEWEDVFFSSLSTTKVSLCQSLQLRFSSLRPCSTESAHREKTEANLSASRAGGGHWKSSQLTSPHAIQARGIASVDLVNDVCIHCQNVSIQPIRHCRHKEPVGVWRGVEE